MRPYCSGFLYVYSSEFEKRKKIGKCLVNQITIMYGNFVSVADAAAGELRDQQNEPSGDAIDRQRAQQLQADSIGENIESPRSRRNRLVRERYARRTAEQR